MNICLVSKDGEQLTEIVVAEFDGGLLAADVDLPTRKNIVGKFEGWKIRADGNDVSLNYALPRVIEPSELSAIRFGKGALQL